MTQLDSWRALDSFYSHFFSFWSTYNFSLQFQDIIKWEGDEKRQIHELVGAFLVENQMLLNFFQ